MLEFSHHNRSATMATFLPIIGRQERELADDRAPLQLIAVAQLARTPNKKQEILTYLDTLAFRKADPGLLLAYDKDVAFSSGEGVVDGILDMDNVETSIVSLTVSDNANATHVTATGHHSDGTDIKLDEVGDLARGYVDFDRVINLDHGIGISNPVVR